MSNKASDWAFEREGLKQGPKFVLVALADQADQDHSCYPGIPEIARRTSASESAVKSNLRVLVAGDFIAKKYRLRKDKSRTSNRYYLDPLGRHGLRFLEPESAGGLEADSGSSKQGLEPESAGALEPESAGAFLNPQFFNHQEDLKNSLSGAIEILADEEPTAAEWFEIFWAAYPRHEGKKPARAKFDIAARSTPPADLARHAEAYRARLGPAPDVKFIPHAATWLHQERWTDEPAPAAAAPPSAVQHNLDLVAHFEALEAHNADHTDTDRPALDAGVDAGPDPAHP